MKTLVMGILMVLLIGCVLLAAVKTAAFCTLEPLCNDAAGWQHASHKSGGDFTTKQISGQGISPAMPKCHGENFLATGKSFFPHERVSLG
jgi:hypothetical protein